MDHSQMGHHANMDHSAMDHSQHMMHSSSGSRMADMGGGGTANPMVAPHEHAEPEMSHGHGR